ncbi:GNAT family N-acetyltransferase [Roseivirga sp. E12]|uniref:GNAT family N-acetyltransferase n=1 Tax=Roseivirga sp. E12 TaxID=2819237 RepID=UPI001ABCE684|nr:GNAT family N-acetyltransferase [Roseivirga sp. E12]MBO3697776.1 GNAT family N-acetyltransferase [Roseivirga sp. E12]
MDIKQLIKASDEDAFLFGQIAKAAKAHWGYPQEWLALWDKDLSFTTEFLNANHVFVIRINGQTIGFCMIIEEAGYFEIEHCWILPEQIGHGYGKHLLSFALAQPLFKDQTFQVLSDPNAMGFYQKFGFETIKMIPGTPKGRELPLMQMTNSRK